MLPSELHTWSPLHHSGAVVTDITVTTCSSISLFSGCDLGEDWHRIQKDLFLGSGWLSHGYVQIKRKKEEDLVDGDQVVMDVRTSRLDPTTSEKDQEEQKWEARQGGIWLLRSGKKHASDSEKAVTAVDVLFGADAVEPRAGWEIKDQALAVDAGAMEPRLSIRRGNLKTMARPQPRINNSGKFKIIQLSDLHLSTGFGVCRDEYPASTHCDADVRTIGFVGEMLDTEKPDLAVLSGDIVNGETSPDSQTAIFKIAELLISRNIPYTIIFGNHDDEGSLSRAGLMSLAQSLPLCLAEPGPATLDGVGNYVLEVLARGTSHHSALTLYFMDSHAYSPDEGHFPGYDWVKQGQIDWFREEAASRRSSSAHKDYAHHHLDMAFIHIPLPEMRDKETMAKESGAYREPPTAPLLNSGLKDALVENHVFALGFGHDHVNDYCTIQAHSDPEKLGAMGAKNEDGSGAAISDEVRQFAKTGRVWLCYAGGAGYGGYGGWGGYERRVRIWDFDMEAARVETWKRVDGKDGKQDTKIVVEGSRTTLG